MMFDFKPDLRELLGPGHTIHLHATDTADAEWVVDLTGDVITWRPSHEKSAVAWRGPVTELLLGLYRRRPPAATASRSSATATCSTSGCPRSVSADVGRSAAHRRILNTLPSVPDNSAPIIYTHTDEAPLLATYSFLPIIQAYAGVAGVPVESRDISLAGRILALFPERLRDDQRIGDALAELGELATRPEANIIKLPNISASIPQLKAAIAELQAQGYDLPDYPDDPTTDEERDVRARYDKVKGSAVNPVLREGNSDRRAPHVGQGVRPQAPALDGRVEPRLEDQRRPHDGRRLPLQRAVGRRSTPTASLRIELVAADGTTTVLRESVPVLAGEVVDATVMHVAALREFLDRPDRPGPGRGRAVLRAPQGDDDEGVRPDHLRARRAGVLPGAVRGVRRRARRRRHQPQRRPRHPARRRRPRCPRATRSRPPSRPGSPPARAWRWSTPTAASPTCTCRPTSSSTRRCRR